MKVASIFCLFAGLILAATGRCRCQDQTLPVYSSKPLEKWIEALKEKADPNLRFQARMALGPNGPYAKVAIPALIDALNHTEPPVRWDAVQTLADYGTSVVPTLISALKRPETPIRLAVAEALRRVRPKPTSAISALREALKDDPVPDVRKAAAESLGTLGRSVGNAVPSLIAALRDEHEDVRAAAALALKEIGAESRQAVPALILALEDKREQVREAAAEALARIGRDARAAVPALIRALGDKNGGDARSAFVRALGEIGPDAKDAVPALVKAIQESDDFMQRSAANALGKIGPDARAAVPALIATVKDGGGSERDAAVLALGAIGPDASSAVPVLMEALASSTDDAEHRYAILKSLGGIGPPAKSAVPALSAIARDQFDDSVARKAATAAVMRIDPRFAADQKMEFAYLNIRLGIVPSIKRAPREAISDEEKKHIKKLIAELAQLRSPDFGMSATLTGHAFAPLPAQKHFGMGLLTNHNTKTSDAFRRLVEIGPPAIPLLLDALDDGTPTAFKVQDSMGLAFPGDELEGNPLNPLENGVLSKEWLMDDDRGGEESFDCYTLKVGDVCFVAIGQIVGRQYSAVRYQPTAIVVVNSPVESKQLRERVRAIWSSKDPDKMLLDSLLIDYATEGIFNGKSLDGWGEGSDRQIQAAMRLLYYFPRETAPLIALRLRSLDVQNRLGDEWMTREVKNRVQIIDFITAISWSADPVIDKALADIARKTNDPAIKAAVKARPKKSP